MTKVKIGMTYEVKKSFQANKQTVREGARLFAGFFGHLVMAELNDDGTINHDKAHPMMPRRVVKLIESGHIELVGKTVQ